MGFILPYNLCSYSFIHQLTPTSCHVHVMALGADSDKFRYLQHSKQCEVLSAALWHCLLVWHWGILPSDPKWHPIFQHLWWRHCLHVLILSFSHLGKRCFWETCASHQHLYHVAAPPIDVELIMRSVKPITHPARVLYVKGVACALKRCDTCRFYGVLMVGSVCVSLWEYVMLRESMGVHAFVSIINVLHGLDHFLWITHFKRKTERMGKGWRERKEKNRFFQALKAFLMFNCQIV